VSFRRQYFSKDLPTVDSDCDSKLFFVELKLGELATNPLYGSAEHCRIQI